LMMASIVYFTRVIGYLIGLQIRHIPRIKPILEALPGCAFMAILIPAIRQGDLTDVISMVCVIGIMWKTENVAVATIIGVCVLLFLGDYVNVFKFTS